MIAKPSDDADRERNRLASTSVLSRGHLRQSEDWRRAEGAVEGLEIQGFRCLRSEFDFHDVSLLWTIVTYCYANQLFGARQIVEWVRDEASLLADLERKPLFGEDIRRFRRNNRKPLTLSLEEYFRLSREGRPFGPKMVEGPYDRAEACVLQAIRWDAGDFDD